MGAYTKFSERLGSLILESAHIRKFTVFELQFATFEYCLLCLFLLEGSPSAKNLSFHIVSDLFGEVRVCAHSCLLTSYSGV